MKRIPLNMGLFVLVDDSDFLELAQVRWRLITSGTKGLWRYAGRQETKGAKLELMHRVILKPSEDEVIDHIDGDGLNNQRSNLRVCSRSQNGCNRALASNNTSGVTGICWDKRAKKWHAYITGGGKKRRIGNFSSMEDAIAARQKAEAEFDPDFWPKALRRTADRPIRGSLTTHAE